MITELDTMNKKQNENKWKMQKIVKNLNWSRDLFSQV